VVQSVFNQPVVFPPFADRTRHELAVRGLDVLPGALRLDNVGVGVDGGHGAASSLSSLSDTADRGRDSMAQPARCPSGQPSPVGTTIVAFPGADKRLPTPSRSRLVSRDG